MNPATNPVPVEDQHGDGRWMSIHNRFLLETKEKEPDVVFIGDSLIQRLVHTEMWNRWFAPMHALNFGIGGDQIQNVLWRIHNGELDHVNPKVVVFLAGTNNINCSAEQIGEGIMEVIRLIREKQPEAYIVVLTLLPRGQYHNPLRDRNAQVNQIVHSKISSLPKCEIVAIDKGFIQPDGTISHHDMHDYLHLTNSGYHKAFEPVHDLLLQLLSEGEPEKDLTPSE